MHDIMSFATLNKIRQFLCSLLINFMNILPKIFVTVCYSAYHAINSLKPSGNNMYHML
jgi:hypothetical protein